ncbi:MAG TPA: hypothetical protein VLZ54_07835, partial [Arenibacter sp.]|nr:hypothetical protein [Arenibacter sp.]
FGPGGFKYSVNGVEASGTFTTPQTVSGLTAQVHNVKVWDLRDDTNCAVPLTQNLTQPAVLSATAKITGDFTCDNTGATITVEAEGGTPGYEYSLNGGTYQSAVIFTNVPAGTHAITVRDAKLCNLPVPVSITVDVPVAPELNVTPTACYTGNNDGTIKVDVIPLTGNGNYRFRLNGGTWMTPDPVDATTYTFTGLANGIYTIDVMDGFGCKAVQVPVELNPQLVASVDVLAISSCADGLITVNATGGNGTLVYAIVPAGADPEGSFTITNTLTITNAMATANPTGYDVYVRDNNGVGSLCFFDQKGIMLTPAIPLELTADPTDPECFDGLGSIEAIVTGGRAPFTYTLVDLSPADGIDYGVSYSNVSDLSYVFTGVGVGNYEITITDADNCSIPAVTAIIENAVEITADIRPLLPEDCDSSVPMDYGFEFYDLVTPAGGVEYSFDGGATWNTNSHEQRGIASGTIVYPSIRVTLASGTTCQKDFPRYIVPYPLDDLDITLTAVVIGCKDLRVTVEGSEGDSSEGYEYTYTDDPTNFNPLSAFWTPQIPLGIPHTFQNIDPVTPQNPGLPLLVPGRTYVFYVRDRSGCVRQSNINVNDIPGINIPLGIITDVDPSCFGVSSGKITYTLNPDNTYPQMRWEFYELNNPTPLQVSGGGATASNVPYNNTITIPGLAVGEYYIRVVQINAANDDECIGGSENALVEELKELKATATATRDISCNLPGLISVTGITGGGGAPYTFDVTGPTEFTPLTGLTSNPVQIPVNSPTGEYIVTLNDQYGCPVILDPVRLELSDNPIITGVTQDNCSAPISLNVTATSLAGNIRYALVASGDPEPASTAYLDNAGIFNNVAPGTYDVYVMDGNGCIDSQLAFKVDPVLSAKVEASLMDCTASPDAIITLEVLAGSGNYAYSVSGAQTLAETAFTGNTVDYNASIPGDYIITVYDKKSQ